MAERSLVEPSTMSHAHPHPFDAVAPRYDADFTDQTLGRWLRGVVWRELEHAFQPGDTALDLGCGTGEDALRLAQRGVNVIATDASAGMLSVAEAKARRAGVADGVTFRRFDLQELADSAVAADVLGLGRDGRPERLDGAFSNFGPLNCLSDRRPLASALAGLIRPGGRLVAVVMGPLCPWELAWYLGHGQARTATRRLRSGASAQVGGSAMRVWYPSPRRLRAELAPTFHHVETIGVGLLLPPSELGHLVRRAPRLFGALRAADQQLSRLAPAPWLSDHYLSIFTRTLTNDEEAHHVGLH